NRNLPEGEAPIIGADVIARGKPALPRVDVESQAIDLWVFEATGQVVGDQGAVKLIAGQNSEHGVIQSSSPEVHGIHCRRPRYRLVTSHPAAPAVVPRPIFRDLRLPQFDGPGVVWDPDRDVRSDGVVTFVDDRATDWRPLQTEMVPADDRAQSNDVDDVVEEK